MLDENDLGRQAKRSLARANYTRNILSMSIPFCIGFFVHAFFFPDLLPQVLYKASKQAVGIKEISELSSPTESTDVLIKEVSYKDGVFNPKVIRVHYGNYISITNTSTIPDDLMWLQSDSSELTTPRGFAESEQLRTTVLKEGTWSVINRVRPDAKLTVIVYR